MLDDLEKKGLVKRERASGDRRAYALFITEKGKKLCLEAQQICAT